MAASTTKRRISTTPCVVRSPVGPTCRSGVGRLPRGTQEVVPAQSGAKSPGRAGFVRPAGNPAATPLATPALPRGAARPDVLPQEIGSACRRQCLPATDHVSEGTLTLAGDRGEAGAASSGATSIDTSIVSAPARSLSTPDGSRAPSAAWSPAQTRPIMPAMRCVANGLLLALVTGASGPVVKQIDHILFATGPEGVALVEMLRDGFQLPVVFEDPGMPYNRTG